jgi:hypothetical protein
MKFRVTGPTSSNKTSSRSHAILQILVEQKWIETDSKNENEVKKRRYKKGLLTIVDLAGSERISKSGSEGIRLEEAKKINLSISSLGNCINALANNLNLQHVPYRESKLTRILIECLGGNSKTSICACVSPYLMNYDETFTTLQFASRAIKIKVNAFVNEKVEMKKTYEKLIDYLNIEGIIKDHKISEKDAKELKNNLSKLIQGKANDINKNEENNHSLPQNDSLNKVNKIFHSQSAIQNNTNNISVVEKEDFALVAKKFSSIIFHLQGELAKSILTIHNLKEENRQLKDKIKSDIR